MFRVRLLLETISWSIFQLVGCMIAGLFAGALAVAAPDLLAELFLAFYNVCHMLFLFAEAHIVIFAVAGAVVGAAVFALNIAPCNIAYYHFQKHRLSSKKT